MVMGTPVLRGLPGYPNCSLLVPVGTECAWCTDRRTGNRLTRMKYKSKKQFNKTKPQNHPTEELCKVLAQDLNLILRIHVF